MSEKRSINQISEPALKAIKSKSPEALPLRPSESGMSSADIRDKFYKFVTDDKSSIVGEIKRIVDEQNDINDVLFDFKDAVTGKEEYKTESKNIVGAVNEIHDETDALKQKLFGGSGSILSSDVLPSYVDDVLEFNGFEKFPATGATGIIYVDTVKNETYRWGGSAYILIGKDVPIAKGTGKGSIVINEGEASGDSSIAGGTTDTELIKSVLGGGYAELIEKYGDISKMSDTVLNILLSAADVGYTLEEFKRILTISPSTAEGLLAISLGASNKAQTAGAISLGFGNISGAKGYYISEIGTTDKTITLSTAQDRHEGTSGVKWKAGDRLSIVNGDRYFAEIEMVKQTSPSMTIVTLKDMPFTELAELKTVTIPLDKTYNITNPSERSVINLDKPESGAVDFGWGAIALGALNTVLGSNAFGVGYKHLIAGDFGASFGMENTVGYSAGAIGILIQALAKATFGAGCGILLTENYQAGFGKWNEENKNALLMVGNGSENKRSNAFEVLNDGTIQMRKLIAGKGCTAEGDYASSRGYETHSDGWAASSEGQGTQANGDRAHSGGHYSYADHEDSFVHGKSLKTSRHRQAIFGEYNKDNSNAVFILGNGTASGRSNAFEVISKNGVCSIKVGNTELTEEQLQQVIEQDWQEITNYIDAEIAEFDFVKVVDELPKEGLPNREYFVRKASPDTNDLFEEYAWVNTGTEEEPNWGWEFKGTKTLEIDLSDYVKKTDYATTDNEGIVRVGEGLTISTSTHKLNILNAQYEHIDAKLSNYRPVTPANLDYAVKVGLTTNAITLTDEEKAAAQTWLGIDNLIGDISAALDELHNYAQNLVNGGAS